MIRKLTKGNQTCLDKPIFHLHHYSYEAVNMANDATRSMYDAINLAKKYAKMLEM